MRRVGAWIACALLAGCIGTFQIDPQPPEPPPPPVPDRFTGDAAPELVDAGLDGCQAAPSLDPHLYYCAKEEHWYRFALNRWFLAFAWNGNWFPVTASELPRALAKVTPKAEEVKKTREEKLEELERRLEELEGKDPAPEGSDAQDSP